MNILPIISSAIGIAGSISANREAAARARRAQQQQDEILRLQRQDYERRLQLYNDQVAQGAFDPTTQLKLNNDTINHEVRQNVGAVQGSMYGRGYIPGDSPMEQQSRVLSERGRLALAQMNQNTTNQARNNQMQAQAFASPSNLSNTYQGYAQQEANAMNGMQDTGALIGQAASYLTPAPKKKLSVGDQFMLGNVAKGLGRIHWGS
jgi:hypothetical protein